MPETARLVSLKIEKFFKLLIQRDADNQRQLGCGAELPGLNGADGIPGNTHHLRQLPLR